MEVLNKNYVYIHPPISSMYFIYNHVIIYAYKLIMQFKSYQKSAILVYNCK